MKTIKSFSIVICMAMLAFTFVAAPVSLLTGCNKGTLTPTTQSIAYHTLFSLGHAVDAAEVGYNDLVVKGLVSSGALSTEAKAYNDFQIAYAAALALVQGNVNAVAPADLISKANAFLATTNNK